MGKNVELEKVDSGGKSDKDDGADSEPEHHDKIFIEEQPVKDRSLQKQEKIQGSKSLGDDGTVTQTTRVALPKHKRVQNIN